MKPSELLAEPKAWTKEAWSRDEKGNSVGVRQGVCWCLVGALLRCFPNDKDYCEEIKRLHEKINPDEPESVILTAWNDAPKRTHAEVLELLRSVDL